MAAASLQTVQRAWRLVASMPGWPQSSRTTELANQPDTWGSQGIVMKCVRGLARRSAINGMSHQIYHTWLAKVAGK